MQAIDSAGSGRSPSAKLVRRGPAGRLLALAVLAALTLTAGCTTPNPDPQPTAEASVTPVVVVEPTAPPDPSEPPPTPLPTPTPEPLAAMVNGVEISLAQYDDEVARCQAGRAQAGFDDLVCPSAVLETLIEQQVILQAATAAGLAVDEIALDAALAGIESELGGPQALTEWLAANRYTPESFRDALAAEQLMARASQPVVDAIGPNADQVHARVILVTSEELATTLLGQLQSGSDFATVAVNYSRDLASRASGGDLGWFPRGVLSVPEVEDAAFSLEPDAISDVFSSALGFHIVQTLERDPARPLNPAAAQALRAAAYDAWLDGLLAQSEIVRFVEP